MEQAPRRQPSADDLIVASTISAAFATDVRLRDMAAKGSLQRVGRGLYYPSNVWNELSASQRYGARVRAVALTRRDGHVLSHQSAAVLWGLPSFRPWPEEVHFLTERASGGRSDPGVRKHALGIELGDVVVRSDVLVTTPARTAVDLAATLDFASAVAFVDRILYVDPFGYVPPLATADEVVETWQRMLPFRGHARARSVLAFATPHSGSLLESVSRVHMALGGFPEPELQHPFVIDDGRTALTDFFWPDYSAIGEADGHVKYVDPGMLAGRRPEDVLIAEKEREDALRRQVRAFTRWDYAVGTSPARLRARLLGLGLPARRPPSGLGWRG